MVIAEGLVFIPKNDRETCHLKFDPPRSGWLLHIGIPRCIIWMKTWRTLQPRRILHASCAIHVHSGFSSGEIRTRALRSGADYSADSSTAALQRYDLDGNMEDSLTSESSDHKTNAQTTGLAGSRMLVLIESKPSTKCT